MILILWWYIFVKGTKMHISNWNRINGLLSILYKLVLGIPSSTIRLQWPSRVHSHFHRLSGRQPMAWNTVKNPLFWYASRNIMCCSLNYPFNWLMYENSTVWHWLIFFFAFILCRNYLDFVFAKTFKGQDFCFFNLYSLFVWQDNIFLWVQLKNIFDQNKY